MRLRKAKDIAFPPGRLSEEGVVVQQKYDGFKALVSKTDRGLSIYTRRGVDVTRRIPKIAEKLDKLLPPGTTVLGELVFLDKGKQSLTKVQSIVGSKEKAAREKLKRMKGRLEYVVYDVLEFRGKDLRGQMLRTRAEHLTMLPTRGAVHRVKDYRWKDRKKAIKESIKAGGEGVVIKELAGIYKWRKKGASEPFGSSWKFKVPGKKANTTDVILESYKKGKEKLIFEAYQQHKGKRIKVGKLSGLDRKTEKIAKGMIDRGKLVVAEVSYQQRQPSGKFRHMGWIRLRPDKPSKSATVRENPMQGPMLWFVVVETPRAARIDSSHASPGLAFGRQLELEEGGGKCLVLSETGLGNYRRMTGKRVPKRAGRTKNPRPSKVKNALSAEALRYDEFENFAERYWNNCARGIYWIPADRHNYDIKDDEKKLIRDGKFFVYCNPIIASVVDLDVRYMAELNLNGVAPSNLQSVRGEDGAKIKVTGEASRIIVQRVIPVDKALRAFKYQLSLLPSSKEELLAFWDMAWEKEELRKKREAEKAERKRKREERKAEREAKRAKKASKKKTSKKKAKKVAKKVSKKRTKKAAKKVAKKRTKKATKKKSSKKQTKKATKKRSRSTPEQQAAEWDEAYQQEVEREGRVGVGVPA